jgi:outer membrane protein OmpA-like peptidoglycan-associated protein
MSKRATMSNGAKNAPSGLHLILAAGVAALGCLYMAPAAEAQQAYYLPQASSSAVTVNYGAITPYGVAPAPGIPGGFQPYGYAPTSALSAAPTMSAAPKSVFAPYAQPVPAYPQPYAQPAYGYAPAPRAPFVAPYANPAFAPGFAANRAGLPISTPTSTGYPQSYLNAPGTQPADATTPKKKRKKKATPVEMPASTPTATEEAAAAQVAAAEAVLESTPAPTAPAPEAPAAAPEPVAEPVPAPTPPAEPDAVPASVPSPVASAPAAAIAPAAIAPAAEQPAASEAAPAEAPAAEAPAGEAPAAEQVASAEAPAETAPDTSGAAVLPTGATRIVFEPGSDELPQGSNAELDALAEKMLGDQNLKVQVLAYSSGTPDAESQARRKALARGLEVRKYLIGKGVRSNRIDVRALGTKSEGNPADRVDIVPSAG